jgi:hypothetical protein
MFIIFINFVIVSFVERDCEPAAALKTARANSDTRAEPLKELDIYWTLGAN